MVAGLAHFLSSGVQLPTAGYGPVHEHLTAGITHPEKVNPSRDSNSASRSSGHSGRRIRTSVSQACGSRPLRFAVSSKLISTNTLGWSDIHNQADYKASHTGISLSGGSGMSASQMVASNAIAGAANALTGMSGSSGHAEGTTSSAISGGNIIIRDKESQKQDIAGLSRDPENANGSIAPIFDREKEQKRLQEAQVISQISGQMSNIVMTYGETEAMKAARAKYPGLSDAQLRETPEYREVMKGYGTGSTPQMVVQAITGVLGGLNAGNPGQVLAGGLNPAVAQLIKQATGDNREANLMAHAVWGALAAQLGGNNAASGAAGAFSGELAARYIIDNYYGGCTDNLSEQERQQISMLVTIASGIAGGLAGNSTSAAGTGAQAGTRLRIMRWVTRMTSCHPLFR